VAEKYFLRSSRLGFRNWLEDDLPLALSLWGDADVMRMIGGVYSEEKVKARLALEISNLEAHDAQYFPTFLLEDDEFVGCCGVKPYRVAERIFKFGYALRRPYWGRGLAEEASRAVIPVVLARTVARALFAGHHPENAASKHILEKLGFRYTHDELYPPDGLMHPSYLMEVTRAPER
jgi:RimJ/RimL family protein N-acetyltransferase